MRAVTDSGSEVATLERAYQGRGYSDFRSDVAEAVNAFLCRVHQRHAEYSTERQRSGGGRPSSGHDGSDNTASRRTAVNGIARLRVERELSVLRRQSILDQAALSIDPQRPDPASSKP
ncbi:MAG: hypothetical protein ACRDYA_10965 [Egibacteraceae bacterium]